MDFVYFLSTFQTFDICAKHMKKINNILGMPSVFLFHCKVVNNDAKWIIIAGRFVAHGS